MIVEVKERTTKMFCRAASVDEKRPRDSAVIL
jgi:hypothetical protein